MKPVFTEEAAREIGYQKYSPELKDWALCIAIALCILTMFGAFVAMIATVGVPK